MSLFQLSLCSEYIGSLAKCSWCHLNKCKTCNNSRPDTSAWHFEIYLEKTSGVTTWLHQTKRGAISSCFCFKHSRIIWKQIEPSPKEMRLHFILFSGCIMHVGRIILHRAGQENETKLCFHEVQLSSVSARGPSSSHQLSQHTTSLARPDC